MSVSTDSRIESARVARTVFPPQEVAEVKAIACELPESEGLPLSRFSQSELHRLVLERGVTEASPTTIARWLAQDALKPWQHRSWIFPRDPDFLGRAAPVLDLYAGRFEGRLLHPGDLVICADEKASIKRLQGRWPNLVLVHLPVHASWLNQAEIYFSIIQRKVLEPNDFESLAALARALSRFEHHYNAVARPFDWSFTTADLAALLERLSAREPQLRLAA